MEATFGSTPESMLKEVNKAIYAIMVTGQEYRMAGRYLKRADLSMLRRMKYELETQIRAGNSALGNSYAAEFHGR